MVAFDRYRIKFDSFVKFFSRIRIKNIFSNKNCILWLTLVFFVPVYKVGETDRVNIRMGMAEKTLNVYRKRAQNWANFLGNFPGVEAIFLSGSLATGKANINSDIDFFVIATPGRIWTARFWIFVCLRLTGNLAKPHNHPGKICPNHFITSDNLEIQDKNGYSAYLFSRNKPLFDPANIFEAFAIKNAWVSEFKESFPVQILSTNLETKLPKAQSKNWTERLLERFQKKKIMKNPDFNNESAKIAFNDQELRFHPVAKSRHWKKPKVVEQELEIHNPYQKP